MHGNPSKDEAVTRWTKSSKPHQMFVLPKLNCAMAKRFGRGKEGWVLLKEVLKKIIELFTQDNIVYSELYLELNILWRLLYILYL